MQDNTQSLLDQLKNDPVLNSLDSLVDQTQNDGQQNAPDPVPQLTEEDLGKFILSHGGKLVQDSTALVNRLQKAIAAGSDPEEIAALSELISSTASAIETLNKIHTQNKKIAAAKELKQQEIEGKKEVARLKNAGSTGNSPSGVVVASREEIFDILLRKGRKDPVIDVELDDEASDVEDSMDISEKDKLGPA